MKYGSSWREGCKVGSSCACPAGTSGFCSRLPRASSTRSAALSCGGHAGFVMECAVRAIWIEPETHRVAFGVLFPACRNRGRPAGRKQNFASWLPPAFILPCGWEYSRDHVEGYQEDTIRSAPAASRCVCGDVGVAPNDMPRYHAPGGACRSSSARLRAPGASGGMVIAREGGMSGR